LAFGSADGSPLTWFAKPAELLLQPKAAKRKKAVTAVVRRFLKVFIILLRLDMAV
jgi:hypothetical protein